MNQSLSVALKLGLTPVYARYVPTQEPGPADTIRRRNGRRGCIWSFRDIGLFANPNDRDPIFVIPWGCWQCCSPRQKHVGEINGVRVRVYWAPFTKS